MKRNAADGLFTKPSRVKHFGDDTSPLLPYPEFLRNGAELGLLVGSAIGPRPLQSLFHLFYRNQGGVIMNNVDLFEVLESFFDFLYPFQPLQGCFVHIISTDVEGDDGNFLTQSRDGGKPCHCFASCKRVRADARLKSLLLGE